MRNRFSLVVLFQVICFAVTAQTSTTNEGVLSFDEAVKIGLRHNFRLQQEKNLQHSTYVNKISAATQLGPQIDASGNAFRVEGNSFNPQRGEVVNGKIDYINGSIDASIPIFNGLTRVNALRQASNLNEAQVHQVVRTTQDVIQGVATRYLTCLLDQELVKISLRNIETQKTQLEQIKTQVELGARAEADLYNQEYQLKNAELTLIRAQNTFKNDLALLAQSLTIDPTAIQELEPVDWSIDEILNYEADISELYQTAAGRRSDLKQAQYSEKAAHYNYSSLKGRYYPRVSAGVSYGSRYNYIHGMANRTFTEQFTKDNTQLSYGVSVTIPIFYGFSSRANTVVAKVQQKNASLLTQSTEVAVKAEVQRAYQNFENAKSALEAAQSQLRAAELTYNTQKERYDLGVSNIVELNTTNQSYVQAQGDYQSALYTLMFQKLLIDYAVGTLTPDDY